MKPTNRLRALRTDRADPLTLERAAELAGVTKGHLCNVELGRHGASPKLVAALAKLYRCSRQKIRELCAEAAGA